MGKKTRATKEPPPTKHSGFFPPPASPPILPHGDPSVPRQPPPTALVTWSSFQFFRLLLTPFPSLTSGCRQTCGPVPHLLTSLLMFLLSEVSSLLLLSSSCCLHTMTPSQSCSPALLPTRFLPPPLLGPQDTVLGKQCPL